MGSLVNAQILGTPLVIMSGQQSRALLTLEGQLTNRDAVMLPRPLVKWSFEAPNPASVPAVMARAAQMAMAAPTGPVFVSVPLDDWKAEADPALTALLVARQVAANPLPCSRSLQSLADRLSAARAPLFVMGAELDSDEGWAAGVKLAERCGAGVFLSIEPARIPFPTRHPNFLGTLGTSIADVRKQLTGYDLVVVLGAQAFRYHAWTNGSYLPDDTHLVLITADSDLAARAPMGDAIVGDAVSAMEQLHPLVRSRPATLPPRAAVADAASTKSGKVSVAEFIEVLSSVCPPDTVFTSESPSLGSWWERVSLTRPRSFYCAAAGALGFALPAAVGVSLADGKRPVVALVGDGSANYSITGLWTAAQHGLPCTFVIVRNGVYEALKDYGAFLDAVDVPGLNLPGIDFVSLAAGYGLAARRVSTASAMAEALKAAISSRMPSLLEVEVEATNSGMFLK
jgi:benzoylformate decarboxylase